VSGLHSLVQKRIKRNVVFDPLKWLQRLL